MGARLATRLFRTGFWLGCIGVGLIGLGLGGAAGGYQPIPTMIWIGFALAGLGGLLLAVWYVRWFKRPSDDHAAAS